MKLSLLFLTLLSTPVLAAPTPAEVYESVAPAIAKAPFILQIEICTADGTCGTFIPEHVRKGGSADLLYQAPKGNGEGGTAETVGEIVGSVGRQVGAGGRVIVDYANEKKSKDGTSESVKVRVEASFGVGSAAAGAAGPAHQQSPINPEN